MKKQKKRKPKSKKSFLKENYQLSWDYLKSSKNFIYISVGLFLIFVIIGSLLPVPDFVTEKILEFIKELIEKTQDMGFSELTIFIFLNNLKTSFFGIILGIFLGIFPLLAIIANGYILGFVVSKTVVQEGFLVLWRLLPHGIFELPAVFISLAMGLKLGTFLFTKNKLENFRNYLLNSLRVFLFIVFPLLVIAAIIEGSLIFVFG